MKRLMTAAAFALLAATAHAADAPLWTVVPSQSTLTFTGTQTGTPFVGHFKTFTAAVAFDPANLAGSHISATVDMASAATGDPQKDGALPGKDWFDTASFRQARFASTRIGKTGAGYVAEGTLTLRGVTKPVTMPFTFDIAGDTATARGHVDLLRADFGVGQGSWASDQYVGGKVGVDAVLVLTK
jgi:polyisoprenoid-binding protein YceI